MTLTGTLFTPKLLRKELPFTVEVILNPNHPIYQAHFPGNPVTPGVCLMQMATELLQSHLCQPLQLIAAANIKFRQPVRPDMRPQFIFKRITKNGERLTTLISIEENDTQYAKMSLEYKL